MLRMVVLILQKEVTRLGSLTLLNGTTVHIRMECPKLPHLSFGAKPAQFLKDEVQKLTKIDKMSDRQYCCTYFPIKKKTGVKKSNRRVFDNILSYDKLYLFQVTYLSLQCTRFWLTLNLKINCSPWRMTNI